MDDKNNKDSSRTLEDDEYFARIAELEEEKARQEALLAQHTAEVEALRAVKEVLEALVLETIGPDPANAA